MTSHNHLVEHLRQLAIHALPRPLYDEDNGDDGGDEEEATAAVASNGRVSIDSMLSDDDASVLANSGLLAPSQRFTRPPIVRHYDISIRPVFGREIR